MRSEKEQVLSQVFGYSSFRPGQEELVDALAGGRDALGIMPTGAGKSVCYQLPALLAPGVTLVISPLISLMQDQVGTLVSMGVRGAYINSALSEAQCRRALDNACRGMYKIIYVAPERLFTPGITRLTRQVEISQVCVDEAHCVSQWGQDFRPSYLDIPAFVESLPRRPVLGAFTATATRQVREDIVRLLGLREPVTVVTGFDRPNLYFGVERPQSKYQGLLSFLAGKEGRSGIVYCLARKTVEEVCDRLNRDGFSATRYHAGLEAEERRRNQEDFLYDRRRIMVATNAFGMGIDKSNVSFVLHYNMPKDLESYYQEAGRAGRDGEPADCVLFYSGQDVRVNRFLIDQEEENPALDEEQRAFLQEQQRERLRQMTFYATTPDCLRRFFLRYFGERPPARCGHCSSCLRGTEEVDLTAEARAVCAFVGRNRGRMGAALAADALRGSRERRVISLGFSRDLDYGSLKHLSQQRVRALIDHLLERGVLRREEGEFPTLTLGELAPELMEGEEIVVLSLPRETPPPSAAPAGETEVDEVLFRALKEVRLRLARQNGVPPFVIFSDATLRDMAARRPGDRAALMQVTGVGQVKAGRYGGAFLDVIARHEADGG